MIELLEGSWNINKKEEWLGSSNDSFEQFEKNLKSQPDDWYWRHNKITYSFNSQGYRCPEWNECNWSQSILIFGCSFVFGVGVSDNDTLSEQLQKITNKPVINLGCSGSSPMFQWVNTVRLRQSNINPCKVVYLWPQASRSLEFEKYPKNQLKAHWGSWSSQSGVGIGWLRHRHQGTYFLKIAIDCCDLLWNCPVYHFYHQDNKVHIYDYVPNSYELPTQIDNARDLKHPGVQTFQLWATYIASIIG